MTSLLNTSFFYSPAVGAQVRRALGEEWLPALRRAAGAGEALTLAMPAEEGIERLAIQAPFASRAEAERFLATDGSALGDALTRRFGVEAFTCFSTLMDIIQLPDGRSEG